MDNLKSELIAIMFLIALGILSGVSFADQPPIPVKEQVVVKPEVVERAMPAYTLSLKQMINEARINIQKAEKKEREAQRIQEEKESKKLSSK